MYNPDFALLPRKCQHPVRIKDPQRPGHYLYVPCGHCDSCVHNRRSVWIRRLTDEQQSSAATLFFTLTYSNSHVPLARVSSDKLSVDVLQPSRCHVSQKPVFHINYLNKVHYAKVQCLDDDTLFAYSSKVDIQKFFKRLRRRLETDSLHLLSHSSFRDRSFRYFICSEYGPHTFRPHYHGLLFFRSCEVAHAAEVYLPSCWKLCARRNIDCSPVVSSASSYVAKYVNCDNKLPDVLNCKAFAPFYLFSRSPSLGSTILSESSVQSNIYSHTLTDSVSTVSVDGVTAQTVTYPRIALCRLFPKPLSFFCYSRTQILSLLRSVFQRSYKGFGDVKVSVIHDRYGVDTYNSFGHKITWSQVVPDIDNDIDLMFGVLRIVIFLSAF